MKPSKSLLIRFVGMIVLVVVMGVFFFKSPNPTTPPCDLMQMKHLSSNPPLWTREGVYISAETVQPHTKLIAVGGVLIFIGSDVPYYVGHLTAVDEKTGNTLWQREGGYVLAASPSMLFVGSGGNVLAINPKDGSVVWSVDPGVRNVSKVLFRQNILYVDGVGGDYHLLDAQTGQVLQSIPYGMNGATNPDLPIWSNHTMNAEFVWNISFFQKPTDYPIENAIQITATNDTTGQQLWRLAKLSSIGKATINLFGILILDPNGSVWRLDPKTGHSMGELVRFAPGPVLYHNCPDGGSHTYGYYLAADSETQMFFVSMEDSAQLFAYRLSEP